MIVRICCISLFRPTWRPLFYNSHKVSWHRVHYRLHLTRLHRSSGRPHLAILGQTILLSFSSIYLPHLVYQHRSLGIAEETTWLPFVSTLVLYTYLSRLMYPVATGGSQASVWIHQVSRRHSQAPFKKVRGKVQLVLFHPMKPCFFVAVSVVFLSGCASKPERQSRLSNTLGCTTYPSKNY